LKGKQKLGVTCNSDELGGIDFTKNFKTDHVQCLGGSPGHHFSKKKSHKFFLHLLALVSKFHNDLLTSPSEKKIIL
jgi:hypothetical protein